MRLGIFGGTFDPVHYGHLLLAEQCREQLELDLVWFVPAAVPPHKREAGISAAEHRVAMLELACAGHPALQISEHELQRGGTSYTVETLSELHRAEPERELFLLMGADSLTDLPTWREPHRILELAHIAAVNRGDAAPAVPEALSALRGGGGRIDFVTMPAVDLSATDMRRRVAAGRSIRFMTPRAVEEYIRRNGLYRVEAE